MPRVPAEDLEAARRLPFVKSATLDELMLTVIFDDGTSHMIMLSDEYPRGEPALFGDDCCQLEPGRLADLIQEVRGLTRGDTQYSDGGGGGMYEYQTSSVHDPAEEDMQSFTAVYGEGSVSHRTMGNGKWVTLHLPIYTQVDKQTAKAWGLMQHETVDVQLKFESNPFTDACRSPVVEVTQAGKQFQLGQQVRSMLTIYLEECYRTKSFLPPLAARQAVPVGVGSANLPNIPQPALDEVQQHLRGLLMGMGFESDRATFAAAQCATVEAAIEFDFEAFSRKERARLAMTLPKDEHTYDATKDANKIVQWSPSAGILLHVAKYVQQRLPTSPQYCVICDKPHLFGANMLRASVCSRDVCVFAFHEFQVGSDAADTIATDGGVIDLLIKMFKAAALSARAEKILTPFPHVMHPSKPREAVFDPKAPDYAALKMVLNHFPTVAEVLGADSVAQLKAKTASKDFRVFPLIEWIINSNRALLVKMDKAHLMPSVGTKHQFLLVTAPPEKQKKFSELKKKHGTKFAFHGSGIENWHAILRGGLRNLSNTDLMTCGAAHGAGIYLATAASTSMGYSNRNTGGGTAGKIDTGGSIPGLINEQGMVCLALCEVVTTGINDHGWCWTVADDNCVMTRFFFVFESGASCSATTGTPDFDAEIKAAVKYYNVD